MNRFSQIGLVAALALLGNEALAGNVRPPLLGREAVLTGGAVVATVKDAGAAWFNPAGLSTVLKSSVDISADAFIFRNYNIPNLFISVLPEDVIGLSVSHTEFVAIPSALIFVRRLSDNVTGSVGLFTKAQPLVRDSDDLWSRTGFRQQGTLGDPGSDFFFEENLTLIQNSSVYHLGPSIGWRISSQLSVGMSAFGIYQNDRGSFQYWTHFLVPEAGVSERTVIVEQQEFEITAFGGQLLFGAQWAFAENWQLGLTLRSPSTVFFHSLDTGVVVARARVAEQEEPLSTFFRFTADTAGENGVSVQPALFTIGMAHDYGKGTVSAEMEVSPDFKNRTWNFDRRLTINARAGWKHRISHTFIVGGGLFSDRTTARNPGGFIQSEIDSYGIAAGIELTTPYEVKDGKAILFSNTLGIRYALGTGQVGGVVVDPRLLGSPQGTISEATFHELDINLASSVHF